MTSLSNEFCAFAVAIALECRPIGQSDKQWSMEALHEELKNSEHSDHHNFHVNCLALHQGIAIFKKPVQQLGHRVVPLNSKKDQFRTEAFMDLPPRSRGSDMIFSTVNSSISRTRDDVVADVLKTANILLLRTFNVTSKYVSVSEICGVLWQSRLNESMIPPDSNKRKKYGDEFGSKHVVSPVV